MSTLEVTDLRAARKFRGLITLLRFFVARRQYNYIDRLSSALNYEVVEETITQMLRVFQALLNQATKVSLDLGEGKILEILALDYEGPYFSYDDIDSRIKILSHQFPDIVVIGKVIHAEKPFLEVGKYYSVYTLPNENEGIVYPSESEIARFLDAARRDIDIAHIIASLALSKPKVTRQELESERGE